MSHYQAICKKNPRVTTPQSHDTVSIALHLITRSVGVICLSRYLQHLTLTGYKTLKQPNYLYTFVIYRDRKTSRTLLCKYRAIPACHRDSFLARNRDNQPDGCAGNAYSLNCRAVSSHRDQNDHYIVTNSR